MTLPFDIFVALRFLREGRFQTWLVIAAAAIGVTVLVFLSALISGLEVTIIDRTLGGQPHVTVKSLREEPRLLARPQSDVQLATRLEPAREHLETIDDWPRVSAQLEQMAGVAGVAPSASGPAVAARGARTRSIVLRGIDPGSFSSVYRVAQRMVQGRYALSGREALIGVELAKDLNVGVGDRLRVEAGGARAELYTIRGLFDMGNKDVNQRWMLVPLRSAQTLLDLGASVSAIDLRANDIFDADVLAARVASRTGLSSESWMVQNAQLLSALNSQRSSKNTIQFFITVAVALSIASVLVVSVVQKTREIGILRATGTSAGQILRVFLLQGAIVGVGGALIGCAAGSALAYLFTRVLRNLDGSPLLPMQLDLSLLAQALLLSICVGLVAAAAPARRASQLDPAEAIRHV